MISNGKKPVSVPDGATVTVRFVTRRKPKPQTVKVIYRAETQPEQIPSPRIVIARVAPPRKGPQMVYQRFVTEE